MTSKLDPCPVNIYINLSVLVTRGFLRFFPSAITWQFAPPNPKDDTPPIRLSSFIFQVEFFGNIALKSSISICGLISLKFMSVGTAPNDNIISNLMKPIIPAAPSRWPICGFTVLKISGNFELVSA
ncbi:hypothetical protein HWI79_132 [Cryptosporidium felis]|nr:hypothetical protein HWI79_132 [Cryptosporidium felis]